MSTVTVILSPDADGTLHLPVPEALRAGRVKVTAILEPADEPGRGAVAPKPDFARIRRQLWGADRDAHQLSPEESAFIRDRGNRCGPTPTPAS